MTSDTASKKNIQKLQRAIVDGLEDVKGQHIEVFNTEHLSPLFERVIVASGTSNRQTKALAFSVSDAVREAGFDKPRMEGEENGEWIIVDCGPAVVHVMQPSIRQYYRLEEIWGEKPVRLKHSGEAKVAAAKAVASKPAASSATKERRPAASGKPKESAASRGAVKKPVPAKKTSAAKPAPTKTAAKKSAAGKPVAGKTTSGKAPAKKAAPVKKLVVKPTTAAKKTARKTASRKA